MLQLICRLQLSHLGLIGVAPGVSVWKSIVAARKGDVAAVVTDHYRCRWCIQMVYGGGKVVGKVGAIGGAPKSAAGGDGFRVVIGAVLVKMQFKTVLLAIGIGPKQWCDGAYGIVKDKTGSNHACHCYMEISQGRQGDNVVKWGGRGSRLLCLMNWDPPLLQHLRDQCWAFGNIGMTTTLGSFLSS